MGAAREVGRSGMGDSTVTRGLGSGLGLRSGSGLGLRLRHSLSLSGWCLCLGREGGFGQYLCLCLQLLLVLPDLAQRLAGVDVSYGAECSRLAEGRRGLLPSRRTDSELFPEEGDEDAGLLLA